MSDDVGELTLGDAWELLRTDASAVLIDVRTEAEWNYVGVPVLDDANQPVRFVEWISYPEGEPNPRFVEQATDGLQAGQRILLLCRSGARSLAAANALIAAGFGPAYNITAGFEGPIDDDGHRSAGWRHAGLPWRQS